MILDKTVPESESMHLFIFFLCSYKEINVGSKKKVNLMKNWILEHNSIRSPEA